MITRDQLKNDIDAIDDANVEVLHRIILALKTPTPTSPRTIPTKTNNPLKGSVTFEHDLLSPVDEVWSAAQ